MLLSDANVNAQVPVTIHDTTTPRDEFESESLLFED